MIPIRTNAFFTIVTCVTFSCLSCIVSAATYALSNESGDFKDRMVSAHSKAVAGDTILIDMDFTVDRPFTVHKAGLTIDGMGSTLTHAGTDERILACMVSDTTFKNINFVGAIRSLKIQNANATLSNLRFENLTISGTQFHGIGFISTNVDNVTITGCTINDKPFGILFFDCYQMTNIQIDNNTFNGGSHQISLDNADLGETQNHSSIRIENNTFNEATMFNVALANTKAALIKSNTMAGGTNPYSQCVHVEDRARNTYIKLNTMNNEGDPGSDAVLVYSTDRFGHGTGALLTYQEKLAYAAGPISLENNTITGAGRDAVILQFLSGNANFYGSNLLIGDNYSIEIWHGEVDPSQLVIADETKFKVQGNDTWANVKNWNANRRSKYVNF